MSDAATFSLRPATVADADLVYRITEASMRRYAEETWGVWDEDATRASFIPETTSIIMVKGRDAGCLELVEEPGALHLRKIYLLPEHQKQGIGSRLLRELQERGRRIGKTIHLRVLRVNPARALYQRHGFEVVARTPERYFMEWKDIGAASS